MSRNSRGAQIAPQPLQLPSPKEQEKILYLKDKNGFTVRIPESKLKAWEQGRGEVESGAYKPSEREIDRMLSLLETLAASAQERQG